MTSPCKCLDASENYPFLSGVYHLANYVEGTPEGQDRVTAYALDFASGREPQTTQWIRLAVAAICPALPFDVIIREERAPDAPPSSTPQLERLCAALARKSGKPVYDAPGFPSASEKGKGMRLLLVSTSVPEEAALRKRVEQLTNSIHGAEVRYFAIVRKDAAPGNDHLDPAYFLSNQSPVASGQFPVSPAPARPEVVRMAGAETPAPLVLQEPPSPWYHLHMSWVTGVATLFAVAAILLFGAFVLFGNRAQVHPPALAYALQQMPLSHPSEPGGGPARDVTAQARPAVPMEAGRVDAPAPLPALPAGDPHLRQAVVTVPTVGLRSGHALDAPPVKGILKKGERVAVLRKLRSSTGPDWVQVRRRSGAVGWLWASVVREVKG